MNKEISKEKKKNNDSVEEETETIEKPSYTYWKRESDNPFSSEFVPTKNDTTVEDKSQSTTVNAYGSAWNKAGTWEEKHLGKSQVEDFLNQTAADLNTTFNNFFKIDNFESYSGDVNFFKYFIRLTTCSLEEK
jgi:hypothetical protein